MFNLANYETHRVSKRLVGILLECLLVEVCFFLLVDPGVHDGSDLRDAVGTRRRGQHRARGEQHLETHLDDRSPQTNTITADDSSEYTSLHIIQ